MGLTKSSIHNDELNYLAGLFATVGAPARLAIIFYLKENGSATVGELTNVIDLSQATLSEHIRLLKRRFFIKGTQTGTTIRYTLHEEVWPMFKDILRDCAEDF